MPDTHFALHRVGELLRFAKTSGCVDVVSFGDSNESFNSVGFANQYELAALDRGHQWWATAIMGCATGAGGAAIGGWYSRSTAAPITSRGVSAAGFAELAKYGEGQDEVNGDKQGRTLMYAYLPAASSIGPGTTTPANHLRFSLDTAFPSSVNMHAHTGEFDLYAGSFGTGSGRMALGLVKGGQRVTGSQFNTNGAEGLTSLAVSHGVGAFGSWNNGTRPLAQIFTNNVTQAVGPCFANFMRYRFTDVANGFAYTPMVSTGGWTMAKALTWLQTTAPEMIELVFARLRSHQPQSEKRLIIRILYGGNDWPGASEAGFLATTQSVLSELRARLAGAGWSAGEYVFLLEGYFGRQADVSNDNYAYREQLRQIATEEEDVAYYSHRVEFSHLDIAANNWFEGGVGVTDAAHLEAPGYLALATRLLEVVEAAQAPSANESRSRTRTAWTKGVLS